MNSKGQFCVKLFHCGNNSIVNPNDQSEKNIFFMPMGIFALADILRKNGVDVEIINSDSEKGKNLQELIDFIALDAVGFDCHWANQSLAVLETAGLIKRIKPEVFNFLGGFTASLFAGEILSGYPQIDAVIRGDAETPIVQLCMSLLSYKFLSDAKGDRALDHVPNLVWRDKENKIRENNFSYVATSEDMDKLDFASIDLLRNWQYYRKRSIYWTNFAPFNFAPFNLSPFFMVEVGRGCQSGCIFCGGNCEAQKKINNRDDIVYRSVDSVITTIKKAMSFGFRTFITDFEFKGSDKWYSDLFDRIEKEKLDIVYVHSSWSLVSKTLIDAISAGFEKAFVQISPETSDVELRKKNKGARGSYINDELEECLDYIKTKKNVKVQLYFGYFLAYESKETVFSTIEYIMKLLLKYPNLLELAYLPFSTDPASLLFSNPEKYDVDMEVATFQDYIKCIEEAYIEKNISKPDMRLFKPRGISKDDAVWLETRIELFNYLFSSYRKSISYLLEKTGDPDTIIKSIKEVDVCMSHDVSDKMRDMLYDTCSDSGILDAYLVETINKEHKAQKTSNRTGFKARPLIWMDCEINGISQEEETELVYGQHECKRN